MSAEALKMAGEKINECVAKINELENKIESLESVVIEFRSEFLMINEWIENQEKINRSQTDINKTIINVMENGFIKNPGGTD